LAFKVAAAEAHKAMMIARALFPSITFFSCKPQGTSFAAELPEISLAPPKVMELLLLKERAVRRNYFCDGQTGFQ